MSFLARRNTGRFAGTSGVFVNLVDTVLGREKNTIQCLPLYSILLALNVTKIDYFSLDVEGAELGVLKTIPFDVIDIRVLTVEFSHTLEGKKELKEYMEGLGYWTLMEIHKLADDFIFVKRPAIARIIATGLLDPDHFDSQVG